MTECRSVVAWGQGWRKEWPAKGYKEAFEGTKMFCILIVAIVSWVCAVKNQWILHFEEMQFIVYKFLNKVDFKSFFLKNAFALKLNLTLKNVYNWAENKVNYTGSLYKYRTDSGHAVSPFWLILQISKH